MNTINLFKKKAKIDINGKTFESPPFSIEVEVKQYLGQFTTGVVRLYNPSDDTIARSERRYEGGKVIYPTCKAYAGYEDNFGICLSGNIKKFSVLRKGKDRVLELTVGDGDKWLNKIINKTYQNMKASDIIADMASGKATRINLGVDPVIKKLYVKTIYDAIENYLKKVTHSWYAFRNGVLTMEPKEKFTDKEYLLDYKNGLIGIPEKINIKRGSSSYVGYRIETLFIYGINLFDIVRVKVDSIDPNKKPLNFKGRVEKVDQAFSTFGASKSKYEIRVVK